MKQVYVTPILRLSEAQKQTLMQDIPAAFHYDEAYNEHLCDADIIIGNPTWKELEACTHLEWLQLNSAGSDTYRMLPEHIHLTNASGTFGMAISEHLLTVCFMLMKKMPQYHRNQKQHIWHNEGRIDSILGSTFVILGMGDLGGEFAKRIHALGGYTIGVKRHPGNCPQYLNELHTIDELETLLPRADVLVMCLPQNEETHHLMNEHTFSLMKPGSYLLNVGRGSAIDEVALYQALQTRLAGASIDVTEVEPLPPDSPLWDCENLIMTPHISGNWNLPSTKDRFVKIAHDNLLAYFHNQPLHNEVNRNTGYRQSIEEIH